MLQLIAGLTILNLENGCENTAFVTVDEDMVEPQAQASVEDELDCITEEIQLDGSGSSTGAIYNYQWNGTGTRASLSQSINVNVNIKNKTW